MGADCAPATPGPASAEFAATRGGQAESGRGPEVRGTQPDLPRPAWPRRRRRGGRFVTTRIIGYLQRYGWPARQR